MTVERVELIHRTDPADESTEGRLVVSDVPITVEIEELDLGGQEIIGIFSVPVGSVEQVRLVLETLEFVIGSEVVEAFVPSGEQTGLKFVPSEVPPQMGEGFEIVADEITAVLAFFDPNDQVVVNMGRGTIVKPTVPTVEADPEDLGFVSDPFTLLVRFEDTASGAEITTLLSDFGLEVVRISPFKPIYTVRIPNPNEVRDLHDSLEAEPIVSYATGNFIYTADGMDVSGMQFWLDENEQNARNAWIHPALIAPTGDGAVLVGIVDGSFDLDNPDLVPNYAINQGELPSAVLAMYEDTNGNGVLDFRDLNDTTSIVNTTLCDGFRDRNLNPGEPGGNICDPLDIVDGDDGSVDSGPFEGDVNGDGCPGVAGVDDDGDMLIDLEDVQAVDYDGDGTPLRGNDGMLESTCGPVVVIGDDDPDDIALAVKDDDENGFSDDLVGWDFLGNDNLVEVDELPPVVPSGTSGARIKHATTMTGRLGADGSDGRGTTGAIWNVQIIPVRAMRTPRTPESFAELVAELAATADLLLDGVDYSALRGAKVVSASWTISAAHRRLGKRGCGKTIELSGRKFRALEREIDERYADTDFSAFTFVNSELECFIDVGVDDYLEFPTQLGVDTLLNVTAYDQNGVILSGFSSEIVDIAVFGWISDEPTPPAMFNVAYTPLGALGPWVCPPDGMNIPFCVDAVDAFAEFPIGGASAPTAFTAGAAALILSNNPTLTPVEVVEFVKNGAATEMDYLKLVAGGRRLDVCGAVFGMPSSMVPGC